MRRDKADIGETSSTGHNYRILRQERGESYCRRRQELSREPRAFSSEVDTGSREENALKQRDREFQRFREARKCSREQFRSRLSARLEIELIALVFAIGVWREPRRPSPGSGFKLNLEIGMNYAYAALTVACLGVAGLLAAGSHMEPRQVHCSEAKKGSIVAVMNCPELAEDGVSPRAAVGKRERDSALARARGQE